jgi:hypothetical protein
LGKWLKLQEDKVKKQYEKRRVEEVIRSRVFFIFETFTENIMKINPVKKEKNRKEK